MPAKDLTCVAGIDEAGRGPVIGPLVVCGIMLPVERVSELTEIGVRDSKRLTPARRRVLSDQIRAVAERVCVRVVSAREIDNLRRRGVSLNRIELDLFVSIVKELHPDWVIMDAADVNAARFGRLVADESGLSTTKFTAEHKADEHNVVVAAASIVAKVRRDHEIELLRKRYGDFGSGYPSDRKTIEYIRRIVHSQQPLPPIVRKTWKSVERIICAFESSQQTL